MECAGADIGNDRILLWDTVVSTDDDETENTTMQCMHEKARKKPVAIAGHVCRRFELDVFHESLVGLVTAARNREFTIDFSC